jgi:hypothetical protein
MSSLNIWRTCKKLHIESACLLLAGIDPRSIMPELISVTIPIESGAGDTDSIKAALHFDIPQAQEAASWLTIARQAAIDGKLVPIGKVRLWGSGGKWGSAELADLSTYDSFDFDVTRQEFSRWLSSLGWTESELPGFLSGINTAESKSTKGEEQRAIEAFGLLVELYASQRGPDYRHGKKPKASRIVEDMLDAIPDDVTNMGDRKLKEHVGAAINAWEAKKHR